MHEIKSSVCYSLSVNKVILVHGVRSEWALVSGRIMPPTLEILIGSDQKKLGKKWRQKFHSYYFACV